MPVILIILALLIGASRADAFTLDTYGGVNESPCANATGHFTFLKVGNRWRFCDPAAHGYLALGVYLVDPNFLAGGVESTKYASGTFANYALNWGDVAIQKIQAWGFNFMQSPTTFLYPSSSNASWTTGDHSPNRKVPFAYALQISRYAMENVASCGLASNIKDMMIGTNQSLSLSYRGYTYVDYYDPHFSTCISNILTNDSAGYQTALGNAAGSTAHSDYFVYAIIDESDQTGFEKFGPDFQGLDINFSGGEPAGLPGSQAGYMMLITRPTQASASPVGMVGTPYTYSDEEVYSKILGMANPLANEYVCTGSGTSLNGALACCTSNHHGTCSVDKNSASYIGASNDASGIALLNTAWTNGGAVPAYTTFATSSTNYTTNLASCLQSGTCGDKWGTGTGLLDEDGTCPTKGGGSCWIGNDVTLVGESASMKADLSPLLRLYVDQYSSVTTTAFHAQPNSSWVLLGFEAGGWGAPSRGEVYEELAKYYDLIIADNIPGWICTASLGCTDSQARVDYLLTHWGDKPYVSVQWFYAMADSAESANLASCTNGFATNQAKYATQAARGSGYATMENLYLNATSTATNTYGAVGYSWWALYDGTGGGCNFGLETPTDNAYNGVDAVISTAGLDAWGYSHGGEAANYGNFTSSATTANNAAQQLLVPAGVGGSNGAKGFGML